MITRTIETSTKAQTNPDQLSIRESELRYRRLFEAAQDGIMILDAETGMINDVNPYLIKMLGYSREEFLKRKLWEVGAFHDFEANVSAFRDLQKNKYSRYENLPLRAKNGALVQVEFVSNVYLVGNQKVIQCNIRNITEQKIAEAALIESEAAYREQSVRDHLTGLFNRRYLEETLNREIQHAKRKGIMLGIIMADIDKFKTLNDTYGHLAGDNVLQAMGKLMLENVRADDIPSRYGGDEFFIILPDVSKEIVLERAEQILKKTRQLKVHFHRKVLKNFTLSIGVAFFPKNGTTFETLLHSVDEALYHAKHNGRGCVVTADDNPEAGGFS
jgi:diguanylate cyclase (GGDEF)-like protein/PAS domain S-box-containing protein